MHRPFLVSSGSAAFVMAKMRFAHVVSGFVLIAAFILRLYWFFRGNFWSRWSAYIPIRREQWRGIGDMLEFYSFLRFDPGMQRGPQSAGRAVVLRRLPADPGRDPDWPGSI